ncbi:MAG: hypothetical protein GF383_06230 [Candidatus Lokiarchaeota archaeon]|nr:hypothetical protein [Candidatus Lokiarchaeota archaeon]MBD3339602.1 hypothetical protein [Candidatus Lokiarchaeota archaeon]
MIAEYILVWTPAERLLSAMAVTIGLICGFLYLRNGYKRKSREEKLVMIGFGSFLIGITVDMLSYYLVEFFTPGYLIHHNYYGTYDIYTSEIIMIDRIGFISQATGCIIFYFTFEYITKRTYYIFTIVQGILLILQIFLPFQMTLFIYNYIQASTLSIWIPTIIFYLYTKWSPKEFKAISSILFLGFIFLTFSRALYSKFIKILEIIPLFVAPLLYILGSLIMVSPLFIKTEVFSEKQYYFYFVGWSFIISFSLFIVFMIYLGLIVELILVFIIDLLFTILLFYLIHLTLKKDSNIAEEKSSFLKKRDLLSVFSRSPRLTEEEVSVAKERKICLICKGKVSGYDIYLCRECSSLYHRKCAKQLEDLENACWACNAPINRSKPVKLEAELEKKPEKFKGKKSLD